MLLSFIVINPEMPVVFCYSLVLCFEVGLFEFIKVTSEEFVSLRFVLLCLCLFRER